MATGRKTQRTGQPVIAADEALQRLRRGNRRFLADRPIAQGRDAARRETLAAGQAPFAAILCCADSRVVPELAFDTGLGELFVVRVAGNVANKATIASLEYAFLVLRTQLIVVMAHGNCGAVAAAVAGQGATPHLHYLLDYIRPAIDAAGAAGDASSATDNTDGPADQAGDADGAADQAGGAAEVDAVARRNATQAARQLAADSEILAAGTRDDGARIVTAFYEPSRGAVEFF